MFKMKNTEDVLLKHLDNPVRILSFSIGDLIAYLAPFFAGSFFDSLFIIPLMGILIIYLLKKWVKKLPKFYLIRFLYWSLPTKRFNGMLGSNLPSSNKRLWVK